MPLCPFAAWKPVAAHGGPIGTILGVVEHVTAGTGDPYNEFVNPANQVSSHFGIGNGHGMADGAIEQYVDTGTESWAQVAGNSSYLSVETEGEPGFGLTPAQVASFGRLMAWANEVHGVPLVVANAPGERGLIGHGQGGVAWGNHPDCPGSLRLAQRPAIFAAAQPPPTPTKGDDMIASTSTGKGYWCVKSTGAVFAYGDAQYRGGANTGGGSAGHQPVLSPGDAIVGIAGVSNTGYWLLAASGAVFAYGAQYLGGPNES